MSILTKISCLNFRSLFKLHILKLHRKMILQQTPSSDTSTSGTHPFPFFPFLLWRSAHKKRATLVTLVLPVLLSYSAGYALPNLFDHTHLPSWMKLLAKPFTKSFSWLQLCQGKDFSIFHLESSLNWMPSTHGYSAQCFKFCPPQYYSKLLFSSSWPGKLISAWWRPRNGGIKLTLFFFIKHV